MGKSLPKSLPDFQRIFPNEEACYTYLYEARFPNGLICPYCNWSGGGCVPFSKPAGHVALQALQA